jgi:drug/metabolite transporter (DMT)-like permease
MAAKRDLVQPPPVQINSRRITVVGTALFFAGFLVLLPWYGWLGRHDHRIWLWTCLAGAILGLLGYAIMRRHRGQGRTT